MNTNSLADNSASVNFDLQGTLLKMKVPNPPAKKRGGLRGGVDEFSSASRKRLMELFARLHPDVTAIFVTLTYPNEFPSSRIAKKHLKVFVQRLKRRCEGWNVAGIWRLEFQERGAPHFHLILFNVPFISKETIQDWWAKTISCIIEAKAVKTEKEDGTPLQINGLTINEWSEYLGYPFMYRQPFTRIEMIRGTKHLMAYVSKYVAKRENLSGLNYDAYRHNRPALNPDEPTFLSKNGDADILLPKIEPYETIGRWWGVIERDNLPYAERMQFTVEFTDPRWFFSLKRHARKRYRRISGDERCGFTLFSGNLSDWLRLIHMLIEDPLPPPKPKD